MEFSKKIFIGVTLGVMLVTIFAMYMVYETKDTSPLSYLITGVFAEFGVATGFYYNKAKAENKIKISKGTEEYNGSECNSTDWNNFN